MSDFASDFDGQEGAIAPSDTLARLKQSLAELLEMEKAVEQMEGDLKAAKQTLQVMRTGRVPDLMNEVGVSSMVIEGQKVELSEFVSGSLPKDPERRKRAIAWLEEHGADGLLKTEVSIEFGRKQHNEALSLSAELIEKGFPSLVSSNIAPQTLAKFARDRIKDGEPIDFEILGLYTGKIAKVTAAK